MIISMKTVVKMINAMKINKYRTHVQYSFCNDKARSQKIRTGWDGEGGGGDYKND